MKRKKHGKDSYNETLKLVQRTRKGRRAVSRFKRFWSLRSPPAIKIGPDIKGMPKTVVSLGISPAITIANGPKGKSTKKVRRKHRGNLVTDESGRRMWILRKGAKRRRKRQFLGWVPVTEYIPEKNTEAAGTHKRNKHWIHEHERVWPKAFIGTHGHYEIEPATYRITDWIRN